MFGGLNIMGIVFSLVKNYKDKEFCDLLATITTHERLHEEHMMEVQKIFVLEVFQNLANSRLIHETHWQLEFICDTFFLSRTIKT